MTGGAKTGGYDATAYAAMLAVYDCDHEGIHCVVCSTVAVRPQITSHTAEE
jgi:hypothetical protein